ncbi:MAG: hypothetical protein K0V04_34490 [Deltaproteobacteria bacterium]|nr:hypothetical protein [Deltaproteobacteria bacterium]
MLAGTVSEEEDPGGVALTDGPLDGPWHLSRTAPLQPRGGGRRAGGGDG